MAADGSTQGEGVLMRNFLFVTEPAGAPVHLFTRTVEAKDASALKDGLKEAEVEARRMGERTLACTVDNASAELLAHSDLASETGAWIPVFGCYFHVSELAIKDRKALESVDAQADQQAMAWVGERLDLADEVSKFFRTRPQLRALMRRIFREVQVLKGPFKHFLGYRQKKFGGPG